jgi:hypothetical protein
MQRAGCVVSTLLAASWAAAAVSQPAPSGDFTMSQVLDYPNASELAAAERADVIAWLRTLHGVRNIWIARGRDFKPVQVTHYREDDGQEQITYRGEMVGKTDRFVLVLRKGTH